MDHTTYHFKLASTVTVGLTMGMKGGSPNEEHLYDWRILKNDRYPG